jgi:hypothetical protein
MSRVRTYLNFPRSINLEPDSRAETDRFGVQWMFNCNSRN